MPSARFLYGFLSQSAEAINIAVPWQISVDDGMFQMNYDLVQSTHDNLISWAKTNWGERPNRFEFGLDARRYLFEPENKAKEALENNARNQLAKYFSYLVVEKLVVSVDSPDSQGPNQIIFSLETSIRETRQRIQIKIEVGN